MPEPVLDRVAAVIGEGPILRRIRELVRRIRERLRGRGTAGYILRA
jgi:hypothetical protein